MKSKHKQKTLLHSGQNGLRAQGFYQGFLEANLIIFFYRCRLTPTGVTALLYQAFNRHLLITVIAAQVFFRDFIAIEPAIQF